MDAVENAEVAEIKREAYYANDRYERRKKIDVNIFETKIVKTMFRAPNKWNVGSRVKRIFPKFHADRSHVRGVNGHSKFDFFLLFSASKIPPKVILKNETFFSFFRWKGR